jgi:hypothetical protein
MVAEVHAGLPDVNLKPRFGSNPYMNIPIKLLANPATAFLAVGLCALTCSLVVPRNAQAQAPVADRIPVIITGGHETEPRDHGRPDVLIAAALGVPTEVFREAFSHVTPAGPGRSPEPEEARRNKSALLRVLAPYGITNERLDEVSNFYRYNRPSGQLVWRNTPAIAYATVQNGAVVGFTIVDAGSGYCSAPSVSVPGMANLKVAATLAFGADFAKNGSIKKLDVAGAN